MQYHAALKCRCNFRQDLFFLYLYKTPFGIHEVITREAASLGIMGSQSRASWNYLCIGMFIGKETVKIGKKNSFIGIITETNGATLSAEKLLRKIDLKSYLSFWNNAQLRRKFRGPFLKHWISFRMFWTQQINIGCRKFIFELLSCVIYF